MKKPGGTKRGHLRVIGGTLKGRKIETPLGQDVRPTSDRVRESLFNMLEHLATRQYDSSPLVDARVLDRFAGTGALGLEAVSRGAAEAWFIERSAATQKLIERNLSAVTDAKIRVGDEGLLNLTNAPLRRPFDLIFCDPPYGFEGWEALVDGFEVANLVQPGTLLVIETDAKDSVPSHFDRWESLKDRRFGRTRLQILERLA